MQNNVRAGKEIKTYQGEAEMASTVRRATQSDAEQIHHAGEHVLEFSVSDETVTFWPKEILKQIISSPEAIVLVAEEADKICGFIIGNCNRAFGKILIENIYVHPSHRKEGIGDALLSKLIDIAKESEYQYVSTLVPLDASEALGLYLDSGFTKGEAFQWLDKPLSGKFST